MHVLRSLSAIAFAGVGLALMMSGCRSQKSNDIAADAAAPTSQATTSQTLPYPATFTEYPPLVRGPLAPDPGSLSLDVSERTDALLSRIVKQARHASHLATGHPPAQLMDLAPYIFYWPQQPDGSLTVVSVETSATDWFIQGSKDRPRVSIESRGLSADEARDAAAPKVSSAAQLASAAYANGMDDRSLYKRWSAVTQIGPQRMSPEEVRKLALVNQMRSLLHFIVQQSGIFPHTVEAFSEQAISFINLQPAADPATAEFVLEWDGVQAYGLSVRLHGSERYEAVQYVESIGLDGTQEPAQYVGDTGVSMITHGSSRLVPRFLFDRHAGRTMTLIGAWNLVPAEQATLPIAGD